MTTLLETDRIDCDRCHRSIQVKDFYKNKKGDPLHTCKKCLASMIDLESESTVMPVLQQIDIPFIPTEWANLKERYMYTERNGQRFRNSNANQTVLGRYIGKMRLPQFHEFRYIDTARFVQEFEDATANEKKEAIARLSQLIDEGNTVQQSLFIMLGGDPTDEASPITKNQMKDLKIKWGENYNEGEMIKLETLYKEMHDSYDIETASHEDYLTTICMISLRLKQAVNNGDYDSVSKLSTQYDKLMKSAKFTASQKKEEEGFIDSISELARLCEEKGFIPVYHSDEPRDIVDVTLRDLNNYTRNLIMKEPGLAQLIEEATEAIKLEEEKDRMGEDEDENLFDDGVITDEDFFRDAGILSEDKWGDD